MRAELNCGCQQPLEASIHGVTFDRTWFGILADFFRPLGSFNLDCGKFKAEAAKSILCWNPIFCRERKYPNSPSFMSYLSFLEYKLFYSIFPGNRIFHKLIFYFYGLDMSDKNINLICYFSDELLEIILIILVIIQLSPIFSFH